MTRSLRSPLAVLFAALLAPLPLQAGGGYYTFTVSASDQDPFVNNPPNPGSGIQLLYVWSLDACNPVGSQPGWSAAEFKVVTPAGTGWEVLGYNSYSEIIDLGPPADATGKNLFLGGHVPVTCGPGFFLVGQLVVLADDGPGVLELGETTCCGNWAVAVNCFPNEQAWAWPMFIRFIGYATQDAGANQDEGSGCGVIPVEPTSWGRIKTLYQGR